MTWMAQRFFKKNSKKQKGTTKNQIAQRFTKV
jgi:hypothetical protein